MKKPGIIVRKVTPKNPGKTVHIKTGDGKSIQVEADVFSISPIMTALCLNGEKEIDIPKATESSIQYLIEFSAIYKQLSVEQTKQILIPRIFMSKDIENPDKVLRQLYYSYKKIPSKEFYSLLGTSYELKIKPLTMILAHIMAANLRVIPKNKLENYLSSE